MMEYIIPLILACIVAALVILDISGVCAGSGNRCKTDQKGLSQGDAEAAYRAHTPDAAGSIPAPATNKIKKEKYNATRDKRIHKNR